MSDLSAPPAGWYPDAEDASAERWWGGTAWTATTRPRNTPAQAPPSPLPLPAAVTMPPAGWYPDPQNAAGEKWFDGADWTQATRQRPGHQYAGAPGQPAPSYGQPAGQRVGAPGRSGFRWVSYGGSSSSSGSPVVGIVVGLIFVAVGLVFVLSSKAPANMSATATATVTNVNISQSTTSRNGRRSAPSCTPVAGFTVGGKPYTASSSVGSSPCPWTVGQPVVVAYDPKSPANAMIPSTGAGQFMPWIVVGIGALAAAGSAYSLVRKKTNKG